MFVTGAEQHTAEVRSECNETDPETPRMKKEIHLILHRNEAWHLSQRLSINKGTPTIGLVPRDYREKPL